MLIATNVDALHKGAKHPEVMEVRSNKVHTGKCVYLRKHAELPSHHVPGAWLQRWRVSKHLQHKHQCHAAASLARRATVRRHGGDPH